MPSLCHLWLFQDLFENAIILTGKTIRLFLRPFYPSGHNVVGTQQSTRAAFRRILVTPSFGSVWLYMCLSGTAEVLSRSWKFHSLGLIALAGMNTTQLLPVFPSILNTVGQDGFTFPVAEVRQEFQSLKVFFSPTFVDPSSDYPGTLQVCDLYWCWGELSVLWSHSV